MEFTSPKDAYFSYVEELFGEVEPVYHELPSSDPNLPDMTVLMFQNMPEPGFLTAVTYGLSEAEHEDWIKHRVELMICIETDDLSWGEILAVIADDLRGKSSFPLGDIIRFEEPIVPEDSDMDAFFVFVPSIIEQEDYVDIDLKCGYAINWVCLYPIYLEEADWIVANSLEEFWNSEEYDPYSVDREMIV
jgi:hypothetical protein